MASSQLQLSPPFYPFSIAFGGYINVVAIRSLSDQATAESLLMHGQRALVEVTFTAENRHIAIVIDWLAVLLIRCLLVTTEEFQIKGKLSQE